MRLVITGRSWLSKKQKETVEITSFASNFNGFLFGGEGGIRTLETL